MNIVKISDMTDEQRNKWQIQLVNREKEREENKKIGIEHANRLFEENYSKNVNLPIREDNNLLSNNSLVRRAYNTNKETKIITNSVLPTRKEYTSNKSVNNVNLPIAEEFKSQLENGKSVQPSKESSLPVFANRIKKDALPMASKVIGGSLLDNMSYVGKKTGAGVAQGTAGIEQAFATEVANNFKKGNQKTGNELLQDVSNSMMLNPISDAKDMFNIMASSINPNKSFWENIGSLGTNIASGTFNKLPIKKQIDAVNQVVGKILPNNASDVVMATNNIISKPIDNFNKKLDEEREHYGTVTQTLGDVGQVVGNMAPSIAVGAVTKNPNMALATMGMSTKGQSTQEALSKGASLEQAIKIGDTKAMIEVGTEMLTGGVNIFGKGALDKIVENGINKKVKNEVLNFLTKKGIDFVGEVGEEVISDILGTVVDRGTVDPNASYSWKDFGDTAITTILSTLVLNALGGGYTKRAYNENVQNMKDYNVQQKLQEAQDIIDNIQNKRNNVLGQQINQGQNKVAQNGNMEQLAPIANNRETLYNNNESEIDIYGKNIEGNNNGTTRNVKNSEQENRKYNKQEYTEWEQSIKPISESELTTSEKELISKAKQEHNKMVYMFDENSNNSKYSAGASMITKGRINISKQKAEVFGLDYMIQHENIESDIIFNDIANDLLTPVIDLVKNDGNFQKQKEVFWQEETGNMPRDELIAKDIVCDRFAELKKSVTLDYQNVLNNATNFSIDEALRNYYKQVYGKELENPSSFNLSQNNVLTNEEIQRNNKSQIYKDTTNTNKLIKEKNDKIRHLENEMLHANSKEQVNRLIEQVNDIENEYNGKIQNLFDKIEQLNIENAEIIIQPNKKVKTNNEILDKVSTRHEVIQKNRELARENIINISTWKDKSSGLKYQLETMERNMYDIIPDKVEAKRMIETYFEPIHEAEANKQRFINKYNDRIKEFKLNKYEAEAVQVLGEKKYNPDFQIEDVDTKKVLDDVNKNIISGKVNETKVNEAIETFRSLYDELYEIENKVLKENGYNVKPYRKGYFPHFIDYVPETRTEKLLNKLGFKIDKRPLPTDIAGITEEFVPRKNME